MRAPGGGAGHVFAASCPAVPATESRGSDPAEHEQAFGAADTENAVRMKAIIKCVPDFITSIRHRRYGSRLGDKPIPRKWRSRTLPIGYGPPEVQFPVSPFFCRYRKERPSAMSFLVRVPFENTNSHSVGEYHSKRLTFLSEGNVANPRAASPKWIS
jgi:hypothetical protein